MIAVRVPADAPIHTVGGMRVLAREHPLYNELCPVCDGVLGAALITLVYVGVDPEDRKQSGWMCGAAVAVHVECTGTAP